MVFKQLNFTLNVTIKDLLLLLLKLLPVIHLEGSQLAAGIQIPVKKMILNHSYSLSINKPNTQLLIIMVML
jgi:hypothetical protein